MKTLYVVGTPIGNLEDITLRALRTLKEADVILAEDTRVTKKLLNHFDIAKKVTRLDAHVEGKQAEDITQTFADYDSIALVSDAGTPTISDPGARLVRAMYESGIRVEPIPGPSALTSALSASGVVATDFVFLGFLPHKKGRQTLLNEIAAQTRTVVLYESVHRVEKLLTSFSKLLDADRRVILARELTKLHEQIIAGSAIELLSYLKNNSIPLKGEFVVIIEAPA